MIQKQNLTIFQGVFALFLLSIVLIDIVKAKEIISALLLFLIFLELTRTITAYLNEGVKVSLRYLIDGAFIFFIRELLFIFSDSHYEFDKKVWYISLIIVIMMFLLGMRWITTKLSPIRENND